ncbi:MAG: hypothetical protein WCI18_02460 [Pseudomonadota bacterium]
MRLLIYASVLMTNILSGCATINIGGGVVMKRSRQGDETPVTDLRTMYSASELKTKEDLLNSLQKKETVKVTGELPAEGFVSPHR